MAVTCPVSAARHRRSALKPIQEHWIHDQAVDHVNRRSMSRIMARRKKAATVQA
jgi:hypothetical protein